MKEEGEVEETHKAESTTAEEVHNVGAIEGEEAAPNEEISGDSGESQPAESAGNVNNEEGEEEVAPIEEKPDDSVESPEPAKSSADDEEFAPTTILIVLGSLMFDPSGEADVLSMKVTTPEDLESTLSKAKQRITSPSVTAMHVILKASSIPSLYEDIILTTFTDVMQPDSEVSIHVLANHSEMPVQGGDVQDLRTSIVLSGLMLESEQLTPGDDGGWILTARTPL